MIVVAFIYLLICLLGIKIGAQEDYLSKEKTSSIKGIFILLVFFSHFNSYVTYTDQFDLLWDKLITSFGQTMVTLFLFYSGYGIAYSIIKKGKEYVDAIPYKRVFLTLVRFDIAVFIYALIKLMLHESFSFQTFCLSLIGFDSMGNSNWYVFTILALYLCTYIAFCIFKGSNFYACIFQIVLTVAYIIIMRYVFNKELYWYDTALCYNVGMFFAFNEAKINRILNNNKTYAILLIIFFIATLFFRLNLINALVDILLMISFSILVVLLSRKISLHNKILKWMGDHLFEIYILQRIPMILLNKLFNNIYIYIIASFTITILLAIVFRYVTDKIVQKINKYTIKETSYE